MELREIISDIELAPENDVSEIERLYEEIDNIRNREVTKIQIRLRHECGEIMGNAKKEADNIMRTSGNRNDIADLWQRTNETVRRKRQSALVEIRWTELVAKLNRLSAKQYILRKHGMW